MKKYIILSLILVTLLATSGCIETGKHSATDTIFSVGSEGLIWRTPVVYLTNDHPSGTYSAIYTVDPNNPSLIKKLEEAKTSGQKVTIAYRTEFLYFPPWQYTSNSIGIIESVEYLNSTK